MTTMFTKQLEFAATQMKHWVNDPSSFELYCNENPEMTELMACMHNMNELRAKRDQDRIDEYFAERDAKSV